MKQTVTRRGFIQASVALLAGASVVNRATATGADEADDEPETAPLFSISLAEWSLHVALRAGKIDHLDFAAIARNDFGINAVEYVNSFFKEKAKDTAYLQEMRRRADDLGVQSLLIMCDGEGRLGDPDDKARRQAAVNHFKWVEAAKFLGCHSVRVNAASEGEYDEQIKLAADGLRQLCEFADGHGLNVLVENHGGLSSNAAWLVAVMKQVNHPRIGTLPDFGNFQTGENQWYDRYQGVREMMPYAKAVSAKSNDFDEAGNETETDYLKMVKIVLDAGYHGHLGIEYEGEQLGEMEGIAKTKALLDRVRRELA